MEETLSTHILLFLMPFLCAEDRGHKYMSSVTLCRGEVFVRQRSIEHLLNLFWRFWDPSASRGDHEPSRFHVVGVQVQFRNSTSGRMGFPKDLDEFTLAYQQWLKNNLPTKITHNNWLYDCDFNRVTITQDHILRFFVENHIPWEIHNSIEFSRVIVTPPRTQIYAKSMVEWKSTFSKKNIHD